VVLSCSSLPVSEPATQAYSESLLVKAESIRSKRGVTVEEIETANELERAANLIRVAGKISSQDQNEIKDLREAKGRNDMLEWLVYGAFAALGLYLLSIIIRRLPV
jgi:hypothetical protein